MDQRDVPRLSPEQLTAIARDLLDHGPAVADVHLLARKLVADAERLRRRSPNAAANHQALATAVLAEARRRAH